jgi:hypothetical protein
VNGRESSDKLDSLMYLAYHSIASRHGDNSVAIMTVGYLEIEPITRLVLVG